MNPSAFPLFAPTDTTDADFDARHPGVYQMFADLAETVRGRGIPRYSADAILHRIRWHHQIERGEGAWKCNNNWTAYLARRLMRDRPAFADFFETRAASCPQSPESL